jgi:hypothetical protein
LPRISPDHPRFPKSYSKRSKEIGRYFKSEFRRLRDEIEGPRYWHPLILENYRYKGDALYKAVKRDLKDNAETYRKILETVGEKDSIIHISQDYGQLDLLLALDSIDRKIYTYLEDDTARAVLKNNYLTHNYSKIKVLESVTEPVQHTANVLILNSNAFSLTSMEHKYGKELDKLILIKSSGNRESSLTEKYGLEKVVGYERFQLYIKN